MAIVHESFAERLGVAAPGSVRIENHRLFVGCAGDTWLELLEVQLEGKKRLDAPEFLHGNPLAAGARLG
jgi:methionyl-tRNA formyltransferase